MSRAGTGESMQRGSVRTLYICMVAALWAATAAAGDLPPLADPPGDLRPGKFVWIDLVTADVAGARRV